MSKQTHKAVSKHLWPNLIWQPLTAVIFICVVLFFLNRISQSDLLWAVGAGALSSSCYIVFGRPSSITADPWNIIGGYLIGMVSGELIRLLSIQTYPVTMDFMNNPYFHIMGMFAAISVGLALVVMAVLNLEHPPAAGLALVLVLDVRDYRVLAVIFVAVIALTVIRVGLRKYLLDLR